ncbi:glycosyltransferase family 2 protein [Rhizosaccharibacter radicis]|uniref:Glycosyltransferase family 92 protein n=1 Tax=Rhizosaccharibacter radicis TaxID=2782605 RepID=A0ABT1VXD6_9PROT|nr:glycosyltransferase family 92 protein [Acetobacteraceae bacterium KSS12]
MPSEVTLSKVRSHHGTLIVAAAATSLIVHGGDVTESVPVWLYRHPSRPELGLLFRSDAPTILGKREHAKSFHPLILEPHPSFSVAEPLSILRDPVVDLLMTAVPGGIVFASTAVAKEWEGFSFVAADEGAIDAGVIAVADVLRRLVEALNTPHTLPAFLRTIPSEFILPAIETALIVLPDEVAQGLCAALLGWQPEQGPKRARPTFDAVPNRFPPPPEQLAADILDAIDPEAWFADAWRDLQNWVRRRNRTRDARSGAAHDLMGIGSGTESFDRSSPGYRFLRHARRLVEPRKRLSIVATARDEGLYFLEWVAHHRMVGVEHIFIYTNNNTDGSDDLLRALDAAGVINWIDNSGSVTTNINMQRKAYSHALTALPDTLDYEWTLIIDLDEFLVPHPFWKNDLTGILRARTAQKADTIAFQWHVFYVDKQVAWSDAPCFERYKISGAHPLIKSAVRTSRFAYVDCHHPAPRDDEARIWRTGDGNLQYGSRATNDIAWINGPSNNGIVCHFAIKSLEEFVWKYARGENDGSGVLLNKRFRYNTTATITSYIGFFENTPGRHYGHYDALLPELQQRIAELKALPGVSAAHDAIVANYRSQIGGLVRNSRDVISADETISVEDRARWNRIVETWEGEQRPAS